MKRLKEFTCYDLRKYRPCYDPNTKLEENKK